LLSRPGEEGVFLEGVSGNSNSDNKKKKKGGKPVTKGISLRFLKIAR